MNEEKGILIAKRIWVNPEKLIRKRRRVTGTVTTGGTKQALYEGAYIATTIVVSNDSTASVWFEIYDGDTKIIGRRTLAANATWEITDAWIPFDTSVGFNSDVTTTILTCGGFTP